MRCFGLQCVHLHAACASQEFKLTLAAAVDHHHDVNRTSSPAGESLIDQPTPRVSAAATVLATSFLSTPRATILSAESGNGLCSAFAVTSVESGKHPSDPGTPAED